MNEGIKATNDDGLKETLSKEFEKKSVRLKEHEAKIVDFCNQTGLARDRYREQQFSFKMENGVIASWGKSVSGKAVATNKWAIDKYTKYHYNKDGTIKATDTVKRIDRIYKPFAVCDMKMKDGHIERTYYDKDSKMIKQIHPTNHGNPSEHPYGKMVNILMT